MKHNTNKEIGIFVLTVVFGITAAAVPGYCEWFAKKEEKKVLKVETQKRAVPQEIKKTESVKVSPAAPDLSAVPALEKTPSPVPAQFATSNVIQLKLGELKAQQENLERLEKMIERERNQLGSMQSDFAINYKVDLEKLKAGKISWDAKTEKLIED